MKYPAPMDLNALRNDIKQDASESTLEIVEETKEDILTEEFSHYKPMNYHLVPPTRKWLRSLFFFPPDSKKFKRAYQTRCIDLLMGADPNMLINLRRIFFVNSGKDIDAIIEETGDEDFPETLLDEWGGLTTKYVGCFWHYQSAIIINMYAIRTTACTIDPNDAAIVPEGVYITLLHELRHLGMDNPYLPENDYPDSNMTEQAVETWARDVYEDVTYQSHRKKGGD